MDQDQTPSSLDTLLFLTVPSSFVRRVKEIDELGRMPNEKVRKDNYMLAYTAEVTRLIIYFGLAIQIIYS